MLRGVALFTREDVPVRVANVVPELIDETPEVKGRGVSQAEAEQQQQAAINAIRQEET